MNMTKGFAEGLKILGLLTAIAIVLWTMPEYASMLKP